MGPFEVLRRVFVFGVLVAGAIAWGVTGDGRAMGLAVLVSGVVFVSA